MKTQVLLLIVVVLVSMLTSACAPPQTAVPATQASAAVAQNAARPTQAPAATPQNTSPAPFVFSSTSTVTGTMATVTFVGGKCSYDGPKQIPSGNFAMNVGTDSSSFLLVVTLDQGKTIQDINAWASTEQPPWANVVDMTDTSDGKILVSMNASWGPIYLVCFGGSPGNATWLGALGPIEVVPK